MGDPSVEVSEETIDASQKAKTQAMKEIDEAITNTHFQNVNI